MEASIWRSNVCFNAPDGDLYFLNSINPFRLEGQKMAMFEMMEQLGWEAPDYVIVPGGNLGNSSAFGKAFVELQAAGLLNKASAAHRGPGRGSQPARTDVALGLLLSSRRLSNPRLQPPRFVSAIRDRGRKRCAQSQHTNGFVMDVTDEEIAEAKAMIGRDGIGCEPASATTLAALRKLSTQRKIDRDAVVVAILTGHALKDTDFIIKSQQLERPCRESCTHEHGGGIRRRIGRC